MKLYMCSTINLIIGKLGKGARFASSTITLVLSMHLFMLKKFSLIFFLCTSTMHGIQLIIYLIHSSQHFLLGPHHLAGSVISKLDRLTKLR